MKLQCTQEDLAKGLSIASRAVATRHVLPVLGNVMLSAEDESRLKLSATNLEISISCWVNARVEEKGAITVPARLLSDLVNSLPPERIDMELVERTQTLNLKCARFEANVKGIAAEEFPLIPSITGDYQMTNSLAPGRVAFLPGEREGERVCQVSLEPEMLREMIRQVTIAAATDESRPILTGVLTKFEGQSLTLVAADGFRLSVRTAELVEPVPEPLSVIIPARAFQEISRIASEEEEPITLIIAPDRNQAFFKATGVELISQLIEGTYPNYGSVIPNSHTTRTVVNTKEFFDALKVAFSFARDRANLVRLQVVPGGELTPGQITIMAASAESGDNVGEIDGVVEGAKSKIALNARYLMQALAVVGTEQVALEMTTPNAPLALKPVGGGNFTHIIMPMAIVDEEEEETSDSQPNAG